MKLLILVIVSLATSLRAETAPVDAPAHAPIFQATWRGLGEFATSPLRIEKSDLPALAYAVIGTGVLIGTDVTLFSEMAKGNARRSWLDDSMPVVSTLGEGWVEVLLVGLGYGLGSDRFSKTSGIALQSLGVVAVSSEVLKTALWSNRPYQDNTKHRFFAYDQSTRGMPSGHSLSAFALAEVYGAEYGRFLPYAFASLVAYSRIYNHAHWPSDVYVGGALGILAGHQARRLAQSHGSPVLRFSMMELENTPTLVAELPF